MTSEADAIAARRAVPGRAAPGLDVPLVGGGTFRLADRRPAMFTLLVFNRGLHCPVYPAQVRELDRRSTRW